MSNIITIFTSLNQLTPDDMNINKIWILFSKANEYNQPAKAFEKLFWTEPTTKELSELIGCSTNTALLLLEGETINECNDKYWIESFTQ